MKYAFIFVLTIFFGVSNAQRVEKISKDDLMKHLRDDIIFWRNKTSVNLSNSKLAMIKYTKLPEAEWSQSKVTGKEVSNLICPIGKIDIYDSLGNSAGMREYYSEKNANLIAISENPELRNKIGFGFSEYNNSGQKITDHILFTDLNNWPNLKDKRNTNFLKLLTVILQNPKADSTINIKLNNRDSKLHLFSLGTYGSDSLPVLNSLADILLKGYEKDFATVYFSGKDSSYEITEDQFGNSKFKKVKINEYIPKVYNTKENPNTQNKTPSSINMNEISLLFERQTEGQNARQIYPGASTLLTTSFGNDQGNINIYLSPLTLKRFSLTSQALINYLIQIYN
jgi:hypothetical protein